MTEVKKDNWWSRKTGFQKGLFIFAMVIFAFSLVFMLLIMNAREVFGNDLANEIFGEGVPNGYVYVWNKMVSATLPWIITVVVIVMAFIVIFISNFITHLFDNKTKKAKTISSLVRSLVKYTVIIAAFCIILINWGVDVIGIVAGVGVLTLVIGLGCQSLIQDVISGLFIVFDDYFSVGDMVIIDGFRGTVTEVGLKTTCHTDMRS